MRDLLAEGLYQISMILTCVSTAIKSREKVLYK